MGLAATSIVSWSQHMITARIVLGVGGDGSNEALFIPNDRPRSRPMSRVRNKHGELHRTLAELVVEIDPRCHCGMYPHQQNFTSLFPFKVYPLYGRRLIDICSDSRYTFGFKIAFNQGPTAALRRLPRSIRFKIMGEPKIRTLHTKMYCRAATLTCRFRK